MKSQTRVEHERLIQRRMFELIDCLDYDDNKGKLDPLTKHRKDQLKEALRNEN
jgi:hypothetical protein